MKLLSYDLYNNALEKNMRIYVRMIKHCKATIYMLYTLVRQWCHYTYVFYLKLY